MNTLSRFARAALASSVLIAGLLALGCARQDTSATTSQQTSTTPEPTPMGGMADLSDANIAAIVVAYNDEEIAHAQLAKEKATGAEVKQFAATMITDHSAVNKKAMTLATRLNLTPEQDDASRKLAADGSAFRQGLTSQSGADFDRSYIANEVALHDQVLNLIDSTLIPSADNAELKTLLEETRPAVQAHLQHARQIQEQLASSTSH